MSLKSTPYLDDFLSYYTKAATLQSMNIGSENGRTLGDAPFNDPLMAWIPIYDTVDRRYAGFSNALQQVWCGGTNPKNWQRNMECDTLHDKFHEKDWMWLFLFHRLTGSGASFESDHGFRNNRVLELALGNENRFEMIEAAGRLLASGQPCFTSIGNQIPPFPKPAAPYKRGSELYIVEHTAEIVDEVHNFITRGQRKSITEVVDYIATVHARLHFKMFHFVLTAWVMDLAEYFPRYVDPESQVYCGKNALESLSLMFDGFKKRDANYAINVIMAETGSTSPMSLEDVLCDAVRYWECYVPKQAMSRLGPWQVENRSRVAHPMKHASYYLVQNRGFGVDTDEKWMK